MQKTIRLTFVLGAVALALAANAAKPPELTGERDNPKWFEPVRDAQELYRIHVKEARAALAQVLADCRAMPREERKGCEEEARRNYEHDLARARAELDGETR